MIAAADPRISYLGMMAPAVTDGVTLIVEQSEALARSSGASETMVAAIRDYTAEAMPLARDGEFAALERVMRESYGRIWDEMTAEEQVIAGDRDTFVELQVKAELPAYTSDWYRSLLAYDPRADWQQVTVPVLAIFGGKDVQVLADSNAAALAEALEGAGNADVEIVTIPDANHLFQEADTGAYAEYSQLEPEFIDGFTDIVVDWMTTRAGVAEPA
jgi:pimeloyl-ACP methyl ester carboxylesterase